MASVVVVVVEEVLALVLIVLVLEGSVLVSVTVCSTTGNIAFVVARVTKVI